MTNYDYVKKMKVLELGDWLCDQFENCRHCPMIEPCNHGNGWQKWLTQEVEELRK